MGDLFTAELMDILIDKYLFTNIPPKFNDFDNGTLINIYLRMITVVDDAYDITRLDCPFDPTQESTQESRQYFLKHIIRCIRPFECSYWAPKTSYLLDKKRALRILISLHEEGMKKHGKGLPQRIRMVIKREEMRNKNLIRKNSKAYCAVVTTDGCETDVEESNAADFFKVNSECKQMSSAFTPVKPSISGIIIPEGHQIPRTPLKLDNLDRNMKDQEMMPPPEFCSPPTRVEIATSCLSPPTEFSDAEGTHLQAIPIFSPPEEFKDISKNNNNADACSPRSHFSINPKAAYANFPSTPLNGKEVCKGNITSNNKQTVILDEKFALLKEKDYHNVINDELLPKAPVNLQFKCKENDMERETIHNTAGSLIDKKFSPLKILKNIDYDETETNHRLSDVAPLRFMDDEDNLQVNYFNGDVLKGRETYDIVPKPLKGREKFVVPQPTKSMETFVVSQPLKSRETFVVSQPFKSRETFVVSQPPKSRETFVVSQPLKSRETFLVSQPLKSKENSIVDGEVESDQHRESDQSVVNQFNEHTDDEENLLQSLNSNCNQSQTYQEVEENSIVTVKQEDGRKTLIKKTIISPDLVSTTVTEINYAKNKAVRHFPKGKELLRTPPSCESSLCNKSYNMDSSLNLSKNDILIQIYMTKKDANNLKTKNTCSLDNRIHESVSESKCLVNYSIQSNSSGESNSLTFDSDTVGNNLSKMTEVCKMDVEEVHGSEMSIERNCHQNLDNNTSVSEFTNELCLKHKKSDLTNEKISVSAINLEINPNTSVNSNCDVEALQTSNTSGLLDDDSLSIFPSKRTSRIEIELKKCSKRIVSDPEGSDVNQQNDMPLSESFERQTLIKESLKLVPDVAKIQEDSKSSEQIEQVDVSKRTRGMKKISYSAKVSDIKEKPNEIKNRKLKTRNKQVASLEKITEIIENASEDVDPIKSTRILTDTEESEFNVRKCRAKAQEKKLKIKEVVYKKIDVNDNIERKDNLPVMECEDKNSCSSEQNMVGIVPEALTLLIKSANHQEEHEINEKACEVVTERELLIDEDKSIVSTTKLNRPINEKNANKTVSKNQQLKCDADECTKNLSNINEIKISRRNKTKSFKTESVSKNKNGSKNASTKAKANGIAGECERKIKQDKNGSEVIKDEESSKITASTNLKSMKSTKSNKASLKNPKVSSLCDFDYLSEGNPNFIEFKVNKRSTVKSSEMESKTEKIENKMGNSKNGSDIYTISDIPKEQEEENRNNNRECLVAENIQALGDKDEVIGVINREIKDKKTKHKKATNMRKAAAIIEIPTETECDKDNACGKIEVKKPSSIKSSKMESIGDIEIKMEKGKNGHSTCTITKTPKENEGKNVMNSRQFIAVVGEKEEVIGKKVDKKDKISNVKKVSNSGKVLSKDSPKESKCDEENKKQSKGKSSKTKLNLKSEAAIDNSENTKHKQFQKFKSEKKVQNADENSFEKCIHIPEKLVHARSPLQVINARPSRRCKTKASEAISKVMNDLSR